MTRWFRRVAVSALLGTLLAAAQACSLKGRLQSETGGGELPSCRPIEAFWGKPNTQHALGVLDATPNARIASSGIYTYALQRSAEGIYTLRGIEGWEVSAMCEGDNLAKTESGHVFMPTPEERGALPWRFTAQLGGEKVTLSCNFLSPESIKLHGRVVRTQKIKCMTEIPDAPTAIWWSAAASGVVRAEIFQPDGGYIVLQSFYE